MDKVPTQIVITPSTRVLVVGLGRSGYAAARLLVKLGAVVKTTDSSPREKINGEVLSWLLANEIELHCGKLPNDLLSGLDLIVVSPGVPLTQPFFGEARAQGIKIIGELALAVSLFNKPIVAITGTNGKSTVTELLGEIFLAAGYKPFVGGNLGVPLAEHLLTAAETDLAILEVSSFQLDTAPDFRPDIGILLNISPDHLDRYDDYEHYAAAKFALFNKQGMMDHAVMNCDDLEITNRLNQHKLIGHKAFFGLNCPQGHKSATVKGSEVHLKTIGEEGVEVYELAGSFLAAEPNTHNAAAAILASRIFGCTRESVAGALRNFRPLGHRLSLVGEFSGVKYFDDSKATNIGAVSAALSGFSEPVILIAGGRDKGGDYRIMLDQVAEKVKAMVLIGEASEKMADVFSGVTQVVMAETMMDAVKKSAELAEDGDSVLLSPACASFDMFDSYAHRGDVFRAAVNSVVNK